MSDILPPLSGRVIDDILGGAGGVVIVSDETIIGLRPVRFNRVPNCIQILIGESQECSNVGMDTPTDEQQRIIREVEDSGGFTDACLTMPMCHRSPKNAWNTAADMLEALAKAARAKAETASDECSI